MSEMSFGRQRLHERRTEAAVTTAGIIERARERLPEVDLPSHFRDLITIAAEVISRGRASVPRDYRGEVNDVVYAEDSPRVVTQLRLLAQGLLALGVSDERALRIIRQAALSSMPQGRARVLAALAHSDEPLSTSRVAELTDLHRKVAGRNLEDWQQVNYVVRSNNLSTESADWRLADSVSRDVRDLHLALNRQRNL